MILHHEQTFLDWTDKLRFFSSGWRKRLTSTLYDRYLVVLTPLRPPLADEEARVARQQRYRKSLRRVNREARRQLKDQQRKNKY